MLPLSLERAQILLLITFPFVFVEAEGEISSSGNNCFPFAGFLCDSVSLPSLSLNFRNNEEKFPSPVLFIIEQREKPH